MDDLISRQDAINLLKKWSDGYSYIEIETKSAIKEFQRLPSAQRWIPCKECKWHGYLTCSNPDGIKGWVTDNDFCSYGEER